MKQADLNNACSWLTRRKLTVLILAASIAIGLTIAERGYAKSTPTTTTVNLTNHSGYGARIVLKDGLGNVIADESLKNKEHRPVKIRFGNFHLDTYKIGARQRDWGTNVVGRNETYNLEIYDGGYTSGRKHYVVLKVRGPNK